MNASSPTQTPTASSLTAGKITRKQLAAHCGLCVRTIDELTRRGVLGHYKIGKAVRYDLPEVEGVLRERFHVGAQVGQAVLSPPSSEPRGSGEEPTFRKNLRPAIHDEQTAAAAANAGALSCDEDQETLGGGWRTNRPTSGAPTCPAQVGRAVLSPPSSEPRGSGEEQIFQEDLRPAIHDVQTAAAKAGAGALSCDGDQETLGGGWRTNRPTECRAPACPAQVGQAVLSPPSSEPRGSGEEPTFRKNLRPAIHDEQTAAAAAAAAANAGALSCDEDQETLDGGLSTNRPTSGAAAKAGALSCDEDQETLGGGWRTNRPTSGAASCAASITQPAA